MKSVCVCVCMCVCNIYIYTSFTLEVLSFAYMCVRWQNHLVFLNLLISDLCGSEEEDNTAVHSNRGQTDASS